ncbi:MAG: hypothetical protein ACKPEN_16585 [Planktothrix sp.]|uniref:hypothetical protein n=1 Tax=Planktothrix sp. TaxID=3088171 RepID=UPI0038D3E56B
MTVKRNKGRPSKLTPEIENKLIKFITLGVPLESASNAIGLDYTTVREWLQRGEGRHPTRGKTAQFEAFADRYQQAVGQCEARLVAKIQSAADKDWKAAAWLLARRHPDRWRSEPKPTSLEDLIVAMAQSGLLTAEQLDQLIKLSESSKAEAKLILSPDKIDNNSDNPNWGRSAGFKRFSSS